MSEHTTESLEQQAAHTQTRHERARRMRDAARDAENERRARRRVEMIEAAERADCDPCRHALAHGWWGALPGRARTHCTDCHLSWSSLRQAHCAVCCAHFTNGAAFDRHQREGGCLDPATAVRTDGRELFCDRSRGGGRPVWGLAFYGQRPPHWA